MAWGRRRQGILLAAAIAGSAVVLAPASAGGAAPGFATAAHFPTGQQPWFVATGDFDGDGAVDVVLPNLHSNSVSVLLGGGDGSFGTKIDTPAGANPGAVAAADFDGDGHEDVAFTNGGDGSLHVRLGDGTGAFPRSFSAPIGAQDVFNQGIAVGDLDGDGHLDIVVSNGSDDTLSVFRGVGDGTFLSAATASMTPAVGAHPELVSLADVNGDGKLDVVVVASGDGAVDVLLGNGDATFRPFAGSAVGANPGDVAVGDLNGDGKADLAVTNYDSATVSVLLGNGDGSFQAQTAFATGANPESVAIADVDGDGHPDLAVANGGSNSVSVLLGDGSGGFAAKQDFATGAGPLSVAAADLDGDGRPDLLTADSTDSTVSALLNTTSPTGSTIGAGGLTQLASPDDCLSESDASSGCGTTTGTGLLGADWAAASPDGKNVYVASFNSPGAVVELARAGDGSLSELGCVGAFGTECATTATGLSEATSVAVSPEGNNVYVTGDADDTVMIFDRNAADGTLTPAGCVQDAAARFDRGCATRVHGMANAYDVAVSPDGKNVYVAAGGGGNERGAVVELARASDGSLSQLASPNDCVEEQGDTTPVCGTTTGTGLSAATALALSPDGTSLYAVADTHAVRAGDAPGALAVFGRDASTGALTQTGCIGEATSIAGITECRTTTAAGLSDVVNVAVSPDGKSVYTASDDATGPIAGFSRANDGTLTPLGCIDSGGSVCSTTAPGLASAFGVAVSPDGANVYVASAGSSSFGGATPVAPGLVELARAPDGTLAASGCIQQAGAADQTCSVTSGHGLGDALGVVVSPDGANVYVASSSTGGAVAAFSRAASAPPSNQSPDAAFSETASGLAVSFDAAGSSDADGTIASYAWDFGDGSSGGGVAPSHTYAGAGTYTVTLTVTDDGGATGTASASIVVSAAPPANSPPTAAFTVSTGNLGASFDASSSADPDGSIASYAWDFGDGATGAGAAPTHAYPSGGTYTVRLTVTDDHGATGVAQHRVTVTPQTATTPVQPPPPAAPEVIDIRATAHLAVAPSAGDKRTSFVFSAAGSLGKLTGYAWDFGDGTSAATPDATHVYGKVGTYTATLTVTDGSGRTSTDTADVVVKNAPPRPAFTYHARTGRAVAFDGTASFDPDGRVRAYRWSFGDGAVAVGRRTVVHRYRGAKPRYTVVLEVVDDSGARVHIRRSVSVRAGAGDVTDIESILVTDVPGVTPPAGLTIIENIGVSDGGTAPIHHPSPRRLSTHTRRER